VDEKKFYLLKMVAMILAKEGLKMFLDDVEFFFGDRYGFNAPKWVKHDDALILEIEAPGMKREEFDVSVRHNVITVATKPSNGSKLRRKFNYSWDILNDVYNIEEISASYVDGLLIVRLPKNEKPSNSIVKITVQ
jgi:HSP20 family molecular chaperone IbpA